MSDENSEAVEYGDHVPEIQVHLPIEEEESNSRSLVHSPVDVGDAEQISIAQMHDLVIQESSSMQVEFSDQDDGVLVSRPGSEECDSEDAKVVDDAGKEDMFVDAPEELISYDGRNTDSRKPMPLAVNQEGLEEINDIRESESDKLDYGRQVHHSVDEEMEVLRAMLEKTVSEKENLERKNKEEVCHFAKELVNLRNKIMALTNQESLIGENDSVLVDRLHRVEKDGDGEITHVPETQLLEMINECSYSLKNAMEERLQTEGTLKELYAMLYTKDSEIEELNSKVTEIVGKASFLEDDNSLLVEQLEKGKGMTEFMNVELGKMRMELEHEKVKSANTKEKLSMAVTKGKALVQQRDSLRQSLAEKTSELDKCLGKLQEKSSALEATALISDELINSKNTASSLQESLSQKDMILEKIEFILSQTSMPEGLQSVDFTEKIRWLVDEITAVGDTSLEFLKVKEALSLIELPGMVASPELVSQVNWLKESFHHAKDEILTLQDYLALTGETAQNEIDHLTTSLLNEIQEKSYLQMVFDDLTSKYEEVLQKEHRFSLEMDQVIRMLLQVLGNDQEADSHNSTDIPMLVERCLEKMKEQNNASLESSHDEADFFEKIQTLLYVKDQELMLCEEILEEEFLKTSKMENLMDDLRVATEELSTLRHEKNSLQKDIERYEEKSAMLREKLSLAVKKGKGLVQDRENLKGLVDEKNKVIEKLNLELQNQESELGDYKDKNSTMSTEVLRIPKLEMDVVSLNEQRGQLERLIEKLNLELQKQESDLGDYKDKINTMSTEVQRIPELEIDIVRLNDQRHQFEKLIEKLNLGLQKQESELGDYKDQNSTMSIEVQRIPKLEMDIVSLNEQKDQLEKFLVESNDMLQNVIEVIDGIILPVDSDFKEPIEKVKWIAGFCNGCQEARTYAEQELEKVREEAGGFATQLEEANSTIKSVEEVLAVAENNLSQIIAEKTCIELKLQTAMEASHTQTSRSLEVSESRKSLEVRIHALMNEKEDAHLGRATAETELVKVNEEVAIQTGKLTDAYKDIKKLEDTLSHLENEVALLTEENSNAQAGRTDLEKEVNQLKYALSSYAGSLEDATINIKSLEDALSQLESEVAVLTKENNNAQAGKTDLENEVKHLKDALSTHTGNLTEATITMKSLEDALLKAENSASIVVHEKEVLEGEILNLKSKLSACLEELSGTHGSLEARSMELVGHLKDLQMLMNDETLLHLLRNSFETNFEKFKEMDLIVKDIMGHFVEIGSEPIEEDSFPTNIFCDSLHYLSSIEDSIIAADGDNISLQFRKIVEGFHSRSKFLGDRFKNIINSMDQYTTSLLGKFHATKDVLISFSEQMGSLKQDMKNMEIYKHAQEDTITTLKNHVASLAAACTDATKELQFGYENKLLGPTPDSELEVDQQRTEDGDYVEMIKKLLLSTTRVHTLIKRFEDIRSSSVSTMEILQNDLEETRKTLQNAVKEKDVSQSRALELEAFVERLQNLCSELRLEVDVLKSKENMLTEKEAEVSLAYSTLLKKENDKEETPMSASELRTLFEKISDIEISFTKSEVGDMWPHSSTQVEKLFYIIDNVSESQHQLKVLMRDIEDLQSTLETHVPEIQQLKNEIEKHSINSKKLETVKSDLSDLTLGLEKLILKLGGNDVDGDPKGLLLVLEKYVTASILASEKSKSKSHELNAKLLGSQKVVDDLSSKLKLLEESIQNKTAPSTEIVQERSIFEAASIPTGSSEISEIEDVGSLAKTVTSPVPSAQMRTMRKGSTDHLVLDIGTETDHLINNEETDEDKGHVFEALNTSGIIPIQGKMFADRIDGIWVSGGRLLMSRPRARLGLIAYWLLLHLWLVGSIL